LYFKNHLKNILPEVYSLVAAVGNSGKSFENLFILSKLINLCNDDSIPENLARFTIEKYFFRDY